MMSNSSLLAPIAKRLEGKVALITGGASGIGETTARVFVQHGAKVVIADIQDDLGRSLCENVGNEEFLSFIHCDVSIESDVQNAVDVTVAKHGKLDIMFSNAGIPGNTSTRILDVDYKNYRRVFDVNVFGAFMTAKHAARVMIPAKKGSIIFTSSVASVTYGDVAHPYSASKHAVVGLTKNLCVELGKYGIRVNCISPFGVPTPMLTNIMFGNEDKEATEEFVCGIANLKEAASDAEIAAIAAIYLGSDESKYVSGLNHVIDGGYSLSNTSLREALKNSVMKEDD